MNRWFQLLAGAAWLCWGGATVCAHPFLQNSWWTVVETDRLVMRVSTTLREVAVAQHLGDATNAVALDRLLAALTNHGDYLLRALRVEADGRRLPGEVLDFRLLADGGNEVPSDSPLYLDQSHATYDLEYKFLTPRQPAELRLSHAMLKEFSYAPGMAWDVTYALLVKDSARRDLGAGLVRSDHPYSLELPSTHAPQTTAAPGPARPEALSGSAGSTSAPPFTDYVKLGIRHILTGYDHLLFLAALALAAVTLGDFLKLILTFTLAHSITVTLAALHLVRLPPWFVEPFIAASIVFVAVENLVAPKRVSSPTRLAVAFGFGLVHGLGFARGLDASLGGVGGSVLALAIFGFCLGVELGHLLVGLPFWGLLRAGRAEWGDRFGRRALRFGSMLVSAGGTYFFVVAVREYF